MINLQKFFDVVDFGIFHEISPFSVKDGEGDIWVVEWADQDFAGIRIKNRTQEVTLDNLGWLHIADLHEVMKSIWAAAS